MSLASTRKKRTASGLRITLIYTEEQATNNLLLVVSQNEYEGLKLSIYLFNCGILKSI